MEARYSGAYADLATISWGSCMSLYSSWHQTQPRRWHTFLLPAHSTRLFADIRSCWTTASAVTVSTECRCLSVNCTLLLCCKSIRWLPVRQRTQYKIAILVHKCLNGRASQYLNDDCGRQVVVRQGHECLASSSESHPEQHKLPWPSLAALLH